MQARLFLFLLVFSTVQLQAQNSGNSLFDDSYLHEVKLYFDEPDFWETMIINYENGLYAEDYIYTESPTVYIDGNLLQSVGVRQKGFSSHFAANYYKKSLKLDFDEFIADQSYDGLKKINLNNGVGDPAFMRDLLCYDMIRQTGAPAPRVAHAKLFINDEYWGVYVLVEQVDKTFLAENFNDNDGNLFKNKGWSSLEWLGTNPNSYKQNFELKTNNTEDDWSGFIQLHDVINNSSNTNFPEQIQQIFDVPNYLKILAIDVMTSNWDSYIEHGRNFYLYQEPNDGKFHWIPWDYNLAMGGDFNAVGSPQVLDTICPMFPDFDMDINIPEVIFTDESDIVPESWFWDFGDGNTSTEQNPTHVYTQIEVYEVCLTIEKEFPNGLCSKTFCDQVDLTIDFSDCPSILNGTCPYPANDPILIEVISSDDFCCNSWDQTCQWFYDFLANGQGGSGGGVIIDYPLLLNNPEKKLINRLMEVDDFRDLYLRYACDILENNFIPDRLYPIIDTQADIIKQAVYDDPNYLFTNNYFDYDIGYGGQANGAIIPQLKVFIETRAAQIQEDLDNTNFDCTPLTSPISAMDIVINELVADNDSTSFISDPDGDFDDWIELYNNTNTTVDLSGFYLTDNNTIPYKWAFPLGTTIEANGYLIVWADNQGAQQGLHADFQLNKSGENLMLLHQDGTIIDDITFGQQTTNQGYARRPNGTGDFVIQASTFNDNNENPVATDEIVKGLFSVHPNPARGVIYISLANEQTDPNFETGLYNSLGQMVFPFQKLTSKNNTITMSIENLPAGLYRVALRGADGIMSIESVIIL